MVTDTCTQELEAALWIKASLDYLSRSCVKQTQRTPKQNKAIYKYFTLIKINLKFYIDYNHKHKSNIGVPWCKCLIVFAWGNEIVTDFYLLFNIFWVLQAF
jgi:hypothetical protein